MNETESSALFGAQSGDIEATVQFTRALGNGSLSSSEYAQLRYRALGRSNIFRSFVIPLVCAFLGRIRYRSAAS
jgi:hypothetical protein